MTKQSLIVFRLPALFDILNEIKEKLHCNLLFKSKDDLLKTNNLENYLILQSKLMILSRKLILVF